MVMWHKMGILVYFQHLAFLCKIWSVNKMLMCTLFSLKKLIFCKLVRMLTFVDGSL